MSDFDSLPAAPPLTFNGRIVHRRGSLIELRSLWHVARRPFDRRPRDWLALPDTQHLLASLRTSAAIDRLTILADLAGLYGLRGLDRDFLVVFARGGRRHHDGPRVWTPWPVGLAYAGFLDPALHGWCAEVAAAASEPAGPDAVLLRALGLQFAALQARLDSLDRHAADLMFLATAGQDLLFGPRRMFSGRSQALMRQTIVQAPFHSCCPCCGTHPVLDSDGLPTADAQFDHFFHASLNRPEHGWLICHPCHLDLSRGGYLMRFSQLAAFRRFQAALLARIHAQRRPSQS